MQSLPHAGRDRSYLLHIPAQVQGGTPVPLVISWDAFMRAPRR